MRATTLILSALNGTPCNYSCKTESPPTYYLLLKKAEFETVTAPLKQCACRIWVVKDFGNFLYILHLSLYTVRKSSLLNTFKAQNLTA
jgi:hypothetical protein